MSRQPVAEHRNGKGTRSAASPRLLTRSLSVLIALSMVAGCERETELPADGVGGTPGETSTALSSSTAPSAIPTSPPDFSDENEPQNDFPVTISPSSGATGTTITITAHGCRSGEQVKYADREAVATGSGERKQVPFRVSGSTLTAEYTVAPEDSIGSAEVIVICSNGSGSTPFDVVPT